MLTLIPKENKAKTWVSVPITNNPGETTKGTCDISPQELFVTLYLAACARPFKGLQKIQRVHKNVLHNSMVLKTGSSSGSQHRHLRFYFTEVVPTGLEPAANHTD